MGTMGKDGPDSDQTNGWIFVTMRNYLFKDLVTDEKTKVS
jgi:hypothetical protein